MGKIVLFLPRDEMIGQAMQILQNQEYQIDVVKRVDTVHVVEEAQQAVQDGADVIIARGNQAMYIKQKLSVPVVDIRATAQELGLLLIQAKKLSGKEFPRIAILANKNMLPDTEHLGEMYGADVRVYTVHSNLDVRLLVRKIVESEPDVVIGGSNVVEAARELNIKTVYFSLTQDGLREAFRVAEMMKYARNIEKKSNAQMKALYDHSFTGILRLDREGRVILANDLMKNILQKSEKEILGKKVLKLLPELEDGKIKKMLDEGGPVYSTFMVIRDFSVNLIASPIVVENEIDGVILFCYPFRNLQKADKAADKKAYRYTTFDEIFHQSAKMQACIHRARSYAQSDSPVYISGEAGTEKKALAEAIYQGSEKKYGPFTVVDCAAFDDTGQEAALFGNGKEEDGAVGRSENGVLLLHHIDFLSVKNQGRLRGILTDGLESRHRVRLLATGTRVEKLAKDGLFMDELFYMIAGLTLEIPPLRERVEDLEYGLDYFFEFYRKKYRRYFTMTKEAKAYLLKLPWYGNLIQVDRFCEKLVLASDGRVINDGTVKDLAEKTDWKRVGGQSTAPIHEESEKEIIQELLERYHGDRQKIADELGVSKVTLWRRMKKYEIE